MRDVPCRLEGREEEEVGIVVERDVLLGLAFENAKLDDWRRVDRTAICRRCSTFSQGALNDCEWDEKYILRPSHKLWHALVVELLPFRMSSGALLWSRESCWTWSHSRP